MIYSKLASLRPPFFALVRGVRTARVMTMSSAFLEVLFKEDSYVSRHTRARG